MSKTYFESGLVKTQIAYAADKPSGLSVAWYPSGVKAKEERWANGQREGLAREWHENGRLKSAIEHAAGKPSGRATEWHENGVQKSEGRYEAGTRVGRWMEWNESGRLQSVVTLKGGIKAGPATEFHAKGSKKRAGTYEADQEIGPWTEWHPNGRVATEVNHVQGQPSGPIRRWYPGGQTRIEGTLVAVTHDDGTSSAKPSGVWTAWYENGSKMSVIDHTKDTATFYEQDGRVWLAAKRSGQNWCEKERALCAAGTLKDGLRTGTWTLTVANSTKIAEIEFKEGHRAGEAKAWHRSGSLASEGAYAQGGIRHGLWTRRNPFGRLLVHDCIVRGIKVWSSFDEEPERSCP